MANKGTWEGKEYISEAVWQKMHADENTDYMGGNQVVCSYTAGGFYVHESNQEIIKKMGDKQEKNLVGWCEEQMNGGREGFYGWMGSGCSIIQWHPELKISFAYCGIDSMMADAYNVRAALLQKVARECTQRMLGLPVTECNRC